MESHFCSQTDHLTPPKGVSAIASQAITVLLPKLWGVCLAPELPLEARERLSTRPEGKGLLPGARPLQVRDAGMRRLPGFSSEPWSLSELVDLYLFTDTVRSLQPPGRCLPRRCCPFKRGRGLVRGGRAPQFSLGRAGPPVSGRAPPLSGGVGEEGGEDERGFTLRSGRAAHAHGRTGPRRPHFLALPLPPSPLPCTSGSLALPTPSRRRRRRLALRGSARGAGAEGLPVRPPPPPPGPGLPLAP